jgi:hypothetical protein
LEILQKVPIVAGLEQGGGTNDSGAIENKAFGVEAREVGCSVVIIEVCITGIEVMASSKRK